MTAWDFEEINQLMEDNSRSDDESLVVSESKTGYTALHFAVTCGHSRHVSRLIKEYRANVNAVDQDGAQPIHIACLKKCSEIMKILLESGADVDAELTKEMVSKYFEDYNWKWPKDLGNKVTLLAFNIFIDYSPLVELLLEHQANFKIRGINNKTLLMCAAKWARGSKGKASSEIFIRTVKYCPEFVRARDDAGLQAIHYVLPMERFSEIRFNYNPWDIRLNVNYVFLLNQAGADLNATINGNPDTIPLNIAAYRCCYKVLEALLDYQFFISKKSKALRLATLPFDHEKDVRLEFGIPVDDQLENVNENRNKCIKLILHNYYIRRKYGIFVPEDEIELMDKLTAIDNKFRLIVTDFENEFNKAIGENKVFRYGNENVLFDDLVKKVFNESSLRRLADDKLFAAFQNFYWKENSKDLREFRIFKTVWNKIEMACYRKKLLVKIWGIKDLKEVIPLPHEVLLGIIEFIDYQSLEKFIQAFYE